MKNPMQKAAAVGLVIGAAFGIAGGAVKDPIQQASLYEISSIGLIYASALLAVMYYRVQQDLIAAGWLLFCIGESAMSTGTSGGQPFSQPMFAAGMAIYVPALIFLSIPRHYPLWSRIGGILAAIVFAISSGMIYCGQEILSTNPLPGAAYGLMTLGFIGYIIRVLKLNDSSGVASE